MFSKLSKTAVRRFGSGPSSAKPAVFNAAVRESAAPAFYQSMWNKLFQRSAYDRVPLDVTHPKVNIGESDVAIGTASDAQITTLKNGIRVATLASSSPIASVSVLTDAGARYETNELSGITNFMEKFMFKSTQNRTEARLVSETSSNGIHLSASSNREHLLLNAWGANESATQMLGSLADVIQFHLLDKIELKETIAQYERDVIGKQLKSFDTIVSESLHEAAYFNNTLGRSMYASPASLESFTPEVLTEFMRLFYEPSRLVVAAIGVDHQTFVNDVEDTFKYLSVAQPGDAIISKIQSTYTGGEIRVSNKYDLDRRGMIDICVGFETCSWNQSSSNDIIAMNVLTMLMGGGGSFSSGGPGKGLYSRLYQNILNSYSWVEHIQTNNYVYTDSGLFVFNASCYANEANKMIDILAKEAHKMTSSINIDELQRAKNQLKLNLLMNGENPNVRIEDLCKQISITGKYTSIPSLLQAIDNVTSNDVQRIAEKLLKSPLSLAAYGDLSKLPRYDAIQKLFQ